MSIKKYITILSTGLFFTPAVNAQEFTFVSDDTYVQVYGGAFQIQNVDFSQSTNIFNISVNASGEYSFDVGYSVGGRYGFPLFPDTMPFLGKFRAEIEGGYHEADYDAVDGTISFTYEGTTFSAGGSEPVDGNVEIVDVYLNLIYDTDESVNLPNIDNLTISPYMGWGLGYTHVKDYIRSIGRTGDQLTVDETEKSTNWGIQAFFGVDMNLGEAVNLGQNLTGGFRVGLRRVNNSNKGVDDALMTSGQFALTYTF